MTTATTADTSGENQWTFDVSLDGKRIGTHDFRLDNRSSQQILTSNASFDVKVLFITAFRYRHQTTEIWQDGCLNSIDASTNNNGEELKINGWQNGDSFEVQRTEDSVSLPACIRSFAYWNRELLETPRLLNSQTGSYEEVSLIKAGQEKFAVGDNQVDAVRFLLTAKDGDITLWYAEADNTWLGLEAPLARGGTLRYSTRSF